MSGEGTSGSGARGDVEVTEPTPAQRAFARGVAESKATIPHVYFELALERRAGLAAVVRASARALRDVPLLNGAYRDGRFERYGRVNVAVGVDAGGTLAFPVVRDADELDEEAIERSIAELAAAARDSTLSSPAFAGATFTVIDMTEVAPRFAPVINHGQAATLGCGSAALTLACDNRIAQTGEGGELLGRIASMLAG